MWNDFPKNHVFEIGMVATQDSFCPLLDIPWENREILPTCPFGFLRAARSGSGVQLRGGVPEDWRRFEDHVPVDVFRQTRPERLEVRRPSSTAATPFTKR